MKKAILILWLGALTGTGWAQRVTVDGVTYRLDKEKEYAMVFSLPKDAKEVTIRGEVEYKGKVYRNAGAYTGIVENLETQIETIYRHERRF